jgi:hypothetical protein
MGKILITINQPQQEMFPEIHPIQDKNTKT